MIVKSTAGGAIFHLADAVVDVRQTAGHRGKPRKEVFSPFDTKIGITGFGTPGGNVSHQFDVDRYLLDGDVIW
jgi:hypothetical protein